jgi:RND family efflux transporter MFP subunit
VEYDNARATYLNSRAQFESAQAALTQSVENLRNTEVRSPVFGVVLNRSISEGDLATTGQAMFEVANLTGFETRVFLPLEDWERVQVGQPVSMSLSGREADIAQGVVSRKSPQLDSTTGLGEVVITLTDAATSVYQGALVQTRINLETKEGVVVIPRAALVEKVDTYIEPETGTIELERTYSAFITQGDTAAVRKELVLGIEQGDRIEVLEGIAPGDKLVITGQQSLEDGSNIQIANAASLPGVTASADTSTTIQPQRAQNLSPEERRELRERLQNMTPEERREFREQREAQRQDTLAENVQSN